MIKNVLGKENMPQTTKSNKNKRTTVTRVNKSRRMNTMTNSRNQRFMVLVVLLAVALIGTIGVAIAAFSTDLYIRGTATMRSTVWDVHFANLQDVVLTGRNAKEITAPTIQTSVDGNPLAAIKTFDVQLKDPGDAVEYTFDVVNAGDLDAELAAITIHTGPALTCSSAAGQEVADRVCAKLNYTLTYADGTAVAVGDQLAKAAGSTVTTKTMKLKLQLDPTIDSADLPTKDVAISNLVVILSYAQDTSETD